MAHAPDEAARLNFGWARASRLDRLFGRTDLGSSLAAMRQNSEANMGRRTVWNPAANRWEQQGGSVTELNGTVRVP